MNLPPQYRLNAYIDSNFDNIQKRLVQFTADVAYIIGFDTLNISLALIVYLYAFNLLSMFLGKNPKSFQFIILFGQL